MQVGHGRARARRGRARRRPSTLEYFPIWSYAHPPAIELAARLADLAPGDLNRVFFTTGGSEAVESAWKLARQYFRAIGQGQRYKVIAREIAYHGTTLGALAITGVPRCARRSSRSRPARRHVPNTNRYRHPLGDDEKAFMLDWLTDAIEDAILFEGPETVAAVFLEPVQNAGGCFVPPEGYFQRVREICDRYGVLLVSDEVICAFGRLGTMFGCERYDYLPDMITCAKGLTSGYSPLGAVICRDYLAEPFLEDTASLPARHHLRRPPGELRGRRSPTSTCSRTRASSSNVRAHEAGFRERLEGLRDIPIVGDVRGAGYFWALELVRRPGDRGARSPRSRARRCSAASSRPLLFERPDLPRRRPRRPGGPARAAARSPGDDEFDEIEAILRRCLTAASSSSSAPQATCRCRAARRAVVVTRDRRQASRRGPASRSRAARP